MIKLIIPSLLSGVRADDTCSAEHDHVVQVQVKSSVKTDISDAIQEIMDDVDADIVLAEAEM